VFFSLCLLTVFFFARENPSSSVNSVLSFFIEYDLDRVCYLRTLFPCHANAAREGVFLTQSVGAAPTEYVLSLSFLFFCRPDALVAFFLGKKFTHHPMLFVVPLQLLLAYVDFSLSFGSPFFIRVQRRPFSWIPEQVLLPFFLLFAIAGFFHSLTFFIVVFFDFLVLTRDVFWVIQGSFFFHCFRLSNGSFFSFLEWRIIFPGWRNVSIVPWA